MNDDGRKNHLIETGAEISRVAENLFEAKSIAVDLEADSLYHYQEMVCLVQIATETDCFLIDPLKAKDISPLKPAFSNVGIRKILHGADYDIRSLYRDFGIEVNNLFDTQTACRFLGIRETGLEAVLLNRFGIKLDKKFQKRDWSRRPLPAEMTEYAAEDVRYLIPLAGILEKELKEKDRLFWVEEECELLTRVRSNSSDRGPLYLKFKGASRLDSPSLTVLEMLLQFRDALARKRNIPPFKVLGNDPIFEMALTKPLTLSELGGIKTLTQKQINTFGGNLVERIHQAISMPPQDLLRLPHKPKPKTEAVVLKRIKALKAWREMRAQNLGLDPGLLMNNALLGVLAKKNPQQEKDLEKITDLKNWQKTTLGLEILSVLKREDGLALRRDSSGRHSGPEIVAQARSEKKGA